MYLLRKFVENGELRNLLWKYFILIKYIYFRENAVFYFTSSHMWQLDFSTISVTQAFLEPPLFRSRFDHISSE